MKTRCFIDKNNCKKFCMRLILFMLIISVFHSQITGKHACAQNEQVKPLEGKYISILGDSISTYAGWSDAQPITDESCIYRYGEAYYGPDGGDFHNTDLLVGDTWWYQAAEALGAEILVSNAGNSTGLLYASYPANLDWQQYLQDMLAYKSRPYYLGTDRQKPDVIALYIGSNDVAKEKTSRFGSVEEIDFETLIKNSNGSYDYAEPATVAEAYCILLHKTMVTYPEAEVYCFTVVPNSSGNLSTCNKRLAAVCPYNEMIKGVADHYGAFVVDIFDEFALDPDGDGMANQEDFEIFKTYFNNDPHPNALGFDVITRRFVATVMENTNYEAPPAEIPGTGDEMDFQLSFFFCWFSMLLIIILSLNEKSKLLKKKELNSKNIKKI